MKIFGGGGGGEYPNFNDLAGFYPKNSCIETVENSKIFIIYFLTNLSYF